MSKETEYHSKDFEWEDLEREVESDPSLSYHLQPFSVSTSLLSSSAPSLDSQAWSDFHTRHSTGKFFKERRYLLKEFPELLSGNGLSKILEVGCGNGSTVLPILRGKENIIIYACDCSSEALEKARMMLYANEVVSVEQRFHPFCCNFATSHFPKWLVCNSCRESNMKKHSCSDINDSRKPQLPEISEPRFSGCCVGGVDFVSLIFTLSAVPLYMMPAALRECFSVLKPGGLVLFRDYGLYDMTMLRFEPQKRVGFREYTRSDGTHSYFFSLDTVSDLFSGAGFIQLEVEYCCVKSLNRKNGKNMRRVWVHAKFQKPICS